MAKYVYNDGNRNISRRVSVKIRCNKASFRLIIYAGTKSSRFFCPPHLLFYSLFIPFYFPFFNTLLKSKGFLLPFRQENVFLHAIRLAWQLLQAGKRPLQAGGKQPQEGKRPLQVGKKQPQAK